MIGFLTLLKREVVRFLKDALDTITPPTVSVVLYLLIFGLALGSRLGEVQGVSYVQFMVPGLILMSVIRNSFLNPAYSLFQSRWDGNIADVLASPLSMSQIALAIVLGGALRGLLIGVLVLLVSLFFAPVAMVLLPLTFLYACMVAIAFAGLGCVVGLWTKGWEGVGTINSFVLDPLVLLGGVFYSLDMVRGVPFIESLTQINPFTHITAGFRSILLGVIEPEVFSGMAVTALLDVLFLLTSIVLFRSGYHLKS